MFRRFLAGLALVSLFAAAAPVPADAFTGRGGARINPVNDAVFEVVIRQPAGGEDYWCAASEYVRRALGLGWQTRIYIVRGRGPSLTTNRKTAVHFTVDPQAAGVRPIKAPLFLNSLRPGDSLTVQRANTYCTMSSLRL